MTLATLLVDVVKMYECENECVVVGYVVALLGVVVAVYGTPY
jgi:hypothetical protein